MLPAMKLPYFGDVLKTVKLFFHVLRISCVVQDFKFQPTFLGYLTGQSECTNAAHLEVY
jgi:hypothetical protein